MDFINAGPSQNDTISSLNDEFDKALTALDVLEGRSELANTIRELYIHTLQAPWVVFRNSTSEPACGQEFMAMMSRVAFRCDPIFTSGLVDTGRPNYGDGTVVLPGPRLVLCPRRENIESSFDGFGMCSEDYVLVCLEWKPGQNEQLTLVGEKLVEFMRKHSRALRETRDSVIDINDTNMGDTPKEHAHYIAVMANLVGDLRGLLDFFRVSMTSTPEEMELYRGMGGKFEF